MVPVPYSWVRFRRMMGWADEETFLDQPHDWVLLNYELYQLECRYGAL